MKLAIDCRMTGSGGIGSYLTSLIPFFCNDFDCYLIGTDDQLEIYRNKIKAELITCNIKTFSLKELLCFPKNILQIINSCDAFYTPYCNIPSGIKIPVFTTIHDIIFLDVPGLASRTGTFIRKCFYNYAILKSKLIFTVSEFSKSRIIYNFKTKKDIIVTYNAVPKWFSMNQLSTSSSFVKEDIPYFLFVGNIKKHKGLSVLLEAFSKSIDNGLNARLFIVGNSENFRTGDNSIQQYLSQIDSSRIKFTGKISDNELLDLYRNAALLIQPSFYEGFGMPPMEALSLGTNVLISDIPVFKEIYKDFPVHFFKTGDSDNLSIKLDECLNLPKPGKMPDIYSFERTYTIIKENIINNL